MNTSKLFAGLAGSALLAGLTGSAFAADVAPIVPPAPPPMISPPPAPVANWTGPYVGGILGYLRSPTLWEDDTFGDAPQTLSGILAGVEAGYRFQTGNLVFGIEGDWAWTNAAGEVDCGPVGAYTCATDFDWLATITGTAGFAIGPSLLVYAEAGIAFADQNFMVTGPALDPMTGGQINRGWVLGGGAVAQLGNGLYIKGEYNYINFGTDEVEVTNGMLTEDFDLTQNAHVFKLGIGLRF
ncbi:MAG: porin family protein [Bauldia sp.]|nr:porin family protein [Bauldia sp.]